MRNTGIPVEPEIYLPKELMGLITKNKQECIPIGFVPTGLTPYCGGVSIRDPLRQRPSWTETLWTETLRTETNLTEITPPPEQRPPDRDPSVNRITDRCKNITFQ